MPGGEEFQFNDEFFLDKEELKLMQTRFARVGFAFHTPDASALFERIDAEAKTAKSGFQRYGLLAVGLALSALLLAAIEPVFIEPAVHAERLPAICAQGIAVLAALAGIAAVAVAWLGVGLGTRRQDWLKTRLIAERLRQWQAQYVCAHVPEILAASHSEQGKEEYQRKRDDAFKQFKGEHVKQVDARLTPLLEEKRSGATPPLWTHHSLETGARRTLAVAAADEPALDELFEAFDEIRFRGQVDYIDYMRGHGRLRSHPRTQHHVLTKAGYGCIIGVLAFDVLVVVGAIFGVTAFQSSIVHLLAICAALFALAVRVLEEGLLPSVHVARLEGYLEEISRAQERFRKSTDPNDKLTQMRALEESAALEMIGFIRTAASARYVL